MDEKNTFENPESSQQKKNENWRQFNHLDKGIKELVFTPPFLSEIPTKNIRKNITNENKEKKAKKCKCMNCKKSLKEKKPTAKFCGLKCKNSFNGRLRTKRNRSRRFTETKQLETIIKNLQKSNLSLLVIYKADGLQYADQLKQSEIKVSPEWLQQTRKVLLTDDKHAPPLEFTTVRAKKLLKEITKININQNLKKCKI